MITAAMLLTYALGIWTGYVLFGRRAPQLVKDDQEGRR